MEQARIEKVMVGILQALRENYLEGPTSRDRVWEVLNALAASAALIIRGSDGPNGEAKEFFLQALDENLKE